MSNRRRRLTGVVTGSKMMKTVTVRVDRSYRHPVYAKVVRSRKLYLAHDELGCHPGDRVVIVESRPISRRKHFAVEKVLARASESSIAAGEVVEAPLLAEAEA